MKYKEFKELPIGTIFQYDDNIEIFGCVVAKIGQNSVIEISDLGFQDCDLDNAGEVNRFSYYASPEFKIAPKWIQEIFKIK